MVGSDRELALSPAHLKPKNHGEANREGTAHNCRLTGEPVWNRREKRRRFVRGRKIKKFSKPLVPTPDPPNRSLNLSTLSLCRCVTTGGRRRSVRSQRRRTAQRLSLLSRSAGQQPPPAIALASPQPPLPAAATASAPGSCTAKPPVQPIEPRFDVGSDSQNLDYDAIYTVIKTQKPHQLRPLPPASSSTTATVLNHRRPLCRKQICPLRRGRLHAASLRDVADVVLLPYVTPSSLFPYLLDATSLFFLLRCRAMRALDFSSLLLFSAIFRVILILYGEWQDAHMEVRYTDVDYLVFSDAASLMASGDSPYKRTTYRYSPLLAFLLIPNSIIHRTWGKFLFSASDLLVGYFIHFILSQRKVPKNLCNFCVMTWLFNPFTFTIGTRGNCEPIVCAMILWVIICLMKGNLLQSAFWYGLVVHFRVYPIIYCIPLVLVLDPNLFRSGQKPILRNWSATQDERLNNGINQGTLLNLLKGIFTRDRLIFSLISGAVFFFFTGLFYYLYGWEFLHEALLYHLTRTDPRHNFSIYFYHIYLHYGHHISVLEKLISFLPQFLVQLVLILCFAPDLPFCLFVQTVAFVAFNKVITAQYFVWFFCLLPLILPWSKMKFKWDGLYCILLWMGAQTHWLMWGYMLEFKGKNVFLQLWVASLVFLAANVFILVMIISHHRNYSFFKGLEHGNSKNVAKVE